MSGNQEVGWQLPEDKDSFALISIAHRIEDLTAVAPTHALLLNPGSGKAGFEVGSWEDMTPAVDAFFEHQRQLGAALT